MPESQDLKASWCVNETVIQIVTDSSQVHAAHAGQNHISCARADLRLNRNQSRGAIEIFSYRIRRLESVDAPPRLGSANLPGSEPADGNLERIAHSRLRSSERSCFIETVSPRSH